MSNSNRTTILPVGETLEHDGNPLRILRCLNAGLTGEVYEGELSLPDSKSPIRVAIKAMKALEFPMARQLFLQESETLAFMMHLEEEANREQKLALKIAPVYHGRGEYEGTPYLVMEFITGKEVPGLLESDGKFPEAQSLTIAWQLYRTLDILHKRLRKTYIDLKFENLWWVEEKNEWGGQLKLTDFGTLEDIQTLDTQERGVKRDLLLSAVYLCKMAIGYMPDYSLGDLNERVEPQLKNADVSWGTQQLLGRLLHRNPAKRPGNASIVANELRSLVSFWTKPVNEVLDIARKYMASAESAQDEADRKKTVISEDGRRYAALAKSAFAIIQRRDPGKDLSHEIGIVDNLLKISGYLERGKNLLLGRSYSLAHQVFDEGMEWSEEPSTLRHWAYLAHIGEDISPSIFEKNQEKAFEALDALNQGNWEEASDRFSKLGELESEGLTYIKSEIDLFTEIQRAESAKDNGKFGQAADSYRKAAKVLSRLPQKYAGWIAESEVGDLQNLAYVMDARQQELATHGKAGQLFGESREHIDKDDSQPAVDKAHQAYHRGWPAPFCFDELHQTVNLALQKNKFRVAFEIAQAAFFHGKPESVNLQDLLLSRYLRRAEEALAISDDLGFRTPMSGALVDCRTHKLLAPTVKYLLGEAEKYGEQHGSHAILFAAADIAAQISDPDLAQRLKTRAEAVMQAAAKERHASIDAILARVEFLLTGLENQSPETLAQGLQAASALEFSAAEVIPLMRNVTKRFEFVRDLLKAAGNISKTDNYRSEDIQALQVRTDAAVLRLGSEVREIVSTRDEVYEQRLQELNRRWLELSDLHHWGIKGYQVSVNQEAQRAIYTQLRQELGDFLVACYVALLGVQPTAVKPLDRTQPAVDPGKEPPQFAVEVLIQKARRSLLMLGGDGGERVKQDIESLLPDTGQAFASAKAAFASGDLARAGAELDQLAAERQTTEEWRTLRTELSQVEIWKAWQVAHAESLKGAQPDPVLLRAIRSYLSYRLPVIYWQNSPASEYVKKPQESARQSAKSAQANFQDSTFVSALGLWLEAAWTAKLATGAPPQKGAWNANQWLEKAYEAIQNKDFGAVARQVTDTPLPEDIPAALASLTPDWWLELTNRAERKVERAKKGRKAFVATSISLAVVAALVFGGLMIYWNWGYILSVVRPTTPTPTVVALVTSEPTIVVTEPPVTEPPTPAPILILPSQYVVDATTVQPQIPVGAAAAWVISPVVAEVAGTTVPNQAIQVTPPLLETGTWILNTTSRDFYSTNKGNADVRWTMDQPFEAGTYEVFVLDTKENSGGYGPQPYEVLLDGQVASPACGQATVIFNTLAGVQRDDAWLSLGVYDVPHGQLLSVHAVVPPLSSSGYFPLSRLLIVKLNDAQLSIDRFEGMSLCDPNRPLVSLLDDSRASVNYLSQENIFGRAPDRYQPLAGPLEILASGGSFGYLAVDPLRGTYNNVYVVWAPSGRLPAGTYELRAWVPEQNATALGEFSLRLDGGSTGFSREGGAALLNQVDFSAEWYSLGQWTLSREGAVSVVFAVKVPDNLGRMIGIDAVALLRVGQP